MSAEDFSSPNTYSVIEPALRLLIPRISSQEVDLIHVVIRKGGHITEYFILGLLLFRGCRGESIPAWNWRWSLLAVIVVAFWAGSDEWHQSFVPTRTASIADVGIDTAGGILAQFVSALSHRYTRK